MYNSKFDMQITATTPFAGMEGEEAKTGITITGLVIAKADFFKDVFIGKKKAGLKAFIDGEIPIDGSMPLKFSQRSDEMLIFPKIKEKIPCQVNFIELDKANGDGEFEVKLKIKIPHTSSKVAGEIVSALRSAVTITIESSQKDMFDEE